MIFKKIFNYFCSPQCANFLFEFLYLCDRYDEWVKADRIIWPVDKGGTKRRQKKKVKVGDQNEGVGVLQNTMHWNTIEQLCHFQQNKDDGEKEEDKQPKPVAKRGRPPLKSTPPSTSRSVSKTPNSEGRSATKTSRLSDLSTLPNGEGNDCVLL